jgi:CheY-like chemotaxis protein
MEPGILPHIFEPFFTTKEVGKGTGLGLATVFGIVKQHNGWIRLHSEPGRGTTFKIFLPAADVLAGKSDSPSLPRPPLQTGSATILLAEDDEIVRSLTRVALEKNGYQVLEAADGISAERLYKEHPDKVNLLLTDLVMPGGVDGQELANRLLERNPNLAVVFTSGYSSDIAGRELVLKESQRFLSKPYSPNQLLETVESCLEGAPHASQPA